MKSLILACHFCLLFGLLTAQSEALPQTSGASLSDIFYMIGNWEGEGWMMIQRDRHEFTQREKIIPKLDSTILVIDGIGHSKDSSGGVRRVIHQAFGVISISPENGQLQMLSYATTGGKMENVMAITGPRQLEWSFQDERGGTIRFREDFSTEGVWVERGDYSMDGQHWFPFFQMTLRKMEE